eukprot:SAG11_NODE_20642_length_441_cov_0.880117_1_plen_65_part_10
MLPFGSGSDLCGDSQLCGDAAHTASKHQAVVTKALAHKDWSHDPTPALEIGTIIRHNENKCQKNG